MNNIKFKEDKILYNVMAANNRYIIASRKIDKENDIKLLEFEVERGAAIDIEDAYEDNKDNCVYTIVDLEKNIRGADNMVFTIFDYTKKEDCEKALEKLNKGEMEISHRNNSKLNIEDTTLSIAKI